MADVKQVLKPAPLKYKLTKTSYGSSNYNMLGNYPARLLIRMAENFNGNYITETSTYTLSERVGIMYWGNRVHVKWKTIRVLTYKELMHNWNNAPVILEGDSGSEGKGEAVIRKYLGNYTSVNGAVHKFATTDATKISSILANLMSTGTMTIEIVEEEKLSPEVAEFLKDFMKGDYKHEQ